MYFWLSIYINNTFSLVLGERPYKCTVCTKGFTKKSNLDIHMQTHSGERPYECNLCIRKFTQSNMLKAHLKTIHDV